MTKRYISIVSSTPILVFSVICAVLTALWRKTESPILSLYEGNFHPLYHLQMFQGAGAGFSSDPDIYSVAFSYPDGQQLSFIHPPFVMLASKILGVGDLGAWEAVHTILGTLAVWWTIYLIWKRLGLPVPAQSATVLLPAALWLDPVRFNFYYGELTVFTVALVATDLWWKRPQRAAKWLPAGLLTGLAAAITLRPLIFAVYFLLRKDTKAAAWMAGGFAVPTLIAAAARPEMSWRYFTDYLFHVDSRVALDQAQNLSLTGAVKRFAPEASQQVLWLVLAAAVAAALVWAAKAFVAAGEDAMAYVCLALVPLLCGPVSLPYSWAWMLPALVVVFEFAVRTRDEWMLLVGLLYLAFTTVFVPHSQFKNMDRIVDRDRVLGDWVMSSVVWWGVFAVAVLAVWGYRQTEREPRRHANRPIARPNQTLESA